VVAGVLSLIKTYGSIQAVAFVDHEPKGAAAGHSEHERKGPDLRLDGMHGRAAAQVVDVTGVSPVATKTWADFLGGHAGAFPDSQRTGRNPLERAAHIKRMSADAKAAAAVKCNYVPAVFLRTGGLHSTFLKFIRPLFPPGLNDTVVAPRFGRTNICDVVLDQIAYIIANGNFAVWESNMRVAVARQAKQGRVSTLAATRIVDLRSEPDRYTPGRPTDATLDVEPEPVEISSAQSQTTATLVTKDLTLEPEWGPPSRPPSVVPDVHQEHVHATATPFAIPVTSLEIERGGAPRASIARPMVTVPEVFATQVQPHVNVITDATLSSESEYESAQSDFEDNIDDTPQDGTEA
jgi:hypothetical protein